MDDRLISTLLSFCLAPFLSGAATYTIGVREDPDEELRDLKGILVPGDEIIIKNGTYSDQALKFIGLGTAEATIVMRAETAGSVLLNGTSYVQFDGAYLQVEGLLWYNGDDYLRTTKSVAVEFRGSEYGHAHHCRLTNCAIIDYNYQFLDTSDSDKDGNTEEYLWAHSKKWVEIFGTNNRVDHCYFYNKRTEGSLLVTELRQDSDWLAADPSRTEQTPQYETVQHRIDHNFFGDIQLGRPDRTENNEAIRIGTSTYSGFNAEIVVENNYFYACNGDAEVISNKSQNNIYRNNFLLRCEGGIVMRHGDGCLIANNVILGEGISDSAGIRINGQDHVIVGNYISDVRGTNMRAALTMRNAGSVTGDDTGGGYEQARFNTIAYNTIINATHPLNLGSSGSSDNDYKPVSNTIVNNLISAPTATAAIVTTLSTSQFAQAVTTWGGNLFHAQSLGVNSIEGISFEDPFLERREDGFRAPDRNGPAHTTAVPGYENLSTDFDGESITTDQSDIGADQLSLARSVQAQIDLSKVGPDWNRDVSRRPLAASAVRATGIEFQVSGEIPLLLSDCALEHATDLGLGHWFPLPAQFHLSALESATLILDFKAPESSAFFRLAPSD